MQLIFRRFWTRISGAVGVPGRSSSCWISFMQVGCKSFVTRGSSIEPLIREVAIGRMAHWNRPRVASYRSPYTLTSPVARVKDTPFDYNTEETYIFREPCNWMMDRRVLLSTISTIKKIRFAGFTYKGLFSKLEQKLIHDGVSIPNIFLKSSQKTSVDSIRKVPYANPLK